MDSHKTYLDYLDKEMTIMGVLSAFSIGVLALALDRIFGADQNTIFRRVWPDQSSYIVAGSILALLSGLMFYRQRSLLAWYYGQISLSLIDPNITSSTTEYLLKEADSWTTWFLYQIGWGTLTLALWAFVAALINTAKLNTVLPPWTIWLPIFASVVFAIPYFSIVHKHRYENHPIRVWRKIESPLEQEKKADPDVAQ